MPYECCWNRDVIERADCPEICDGEEELLFSRAQRSLIKCVECSRFLNDMKRLEEEGNPLAEMMADLSLDYSRQRNQIASLSSFLDNKTLEIRFLNELGHVLQSSVDLDEVLSVALTAVTAGKGFGMNRAFLLLADREEGILKGYLGIGPRNLEEASQVWDEISHNDMDLKSLAQNFRLNKLSSERAKFHDILTRLTIPLARKDHLLVKSLDAKHPVRIDGAFQHPDVPPELASLLGVDAFLLMPLVSRNRRIGMIIADNCVTHREITKEDLHSLETFAFPVAFAIERASLYDKLQLELDRVTDAGKKLQAQQEVIVRMENMALIGRITSSIAHSIRNPLMVIGGFARSILKSSLESDPKRGFVESIVAETRQLEVVLDDILNYSDSIYPTRDFWDVYQLVESSLRENHDALEARGYTAGYISPGHDLPRVYIDFKQLLYCLKAVMQNDVGVVVGTEKSICIMSISVDGGVVLLLEDRSRRMSQGEIDRLLVPFSDTFDLGSGLGLALCKTMLEKQGIPFHVEADMEQGLRYSIILPTYKEETE